LVLVDLALLHQGKPKERLVQILFYKTQVEQLHLLAVAAAVVL
jgi:hypothetical protein